MLKKFKKQSPIETYEIKSYLDGHIFSYGRIGAGKSVSTKGIIEGFHQMGYKIFDLYGGERHEGLYWTIPSQEKHYWQKLNLIGKFDEEGPKQYKVNLLYPYFDSKLPKKIPFKKGVVNSKLFTIPLQDITIEDIMMIIGIPSESSKYCWNELQQIITKKNNAGDLEEKAAQIKGISNTPILKNFIKPMSREMFCMDAYCNFNLDLVEEMKDKETISVLCLDFVPREFHLFVIHYICRKMAELIDANKIGRKNICFIREAATFFRATDDSVVEDRFKIFRTQLAMFIRMGRRGQYFCLDCQSAAETKGLVSGSEDFLLIFKTTSWRDKQELTDELKRERRMTPNQVSDLGFLERGQCLDENTEILIEKNGVKKVKIKDLPKKFNILSFNFKENKIEVCEARKTYSGIKQGTVLNFSKTNIIASDEHRFFDKNGNEKEVKDIKKGDDLFSKIIYTKNRVKKIKKSLRNYYKINPVSKRQRKVLSELAIKRGSGKWMKNRKLPKTTIEKVRKSSIKMWKEPNRGKVHSKMLKKFFKNHPEIVEKRNKKTKKTWSKEKRKQHGLGMINIRKQYPLHYRVTDKTKRKIRKTTTMVSQSIVAGNPEFMKNTMRKASLRPNQQEASILKIVKKYGFKYIGDGSKQIELYNPDFINEKDKKIIEFFGEYWHRNTKRRDDNKIYRYKKNGYKVLVVQEKEYNKNREKIIKQIVNFCKR